MVKQKTLLIILIIISQFGCISEVEYEDPSKERDIEFLQEITQRQNNSIEFTLHNYSDIIKREYIVVQDNKVKKSGVIYYEKLIFDSLEPGEYTVIFEYTTNDGTIIRSKDYKFRIGESSEDVAINNLDIIRINNNEIDLVMYVQNKQNMDLYLTEIDMSFQDQSGKDISFLFGRGKNFVPTLLKPGEEKRIQLNYTCDSNIDDLYVEIVINGKTEGVMDPIKFTSKRQLAKVIDKSEIKTIASDYNSTYLEGESIDLDIEVLGINKGSIIISYGEQIIRRNFIESQSINIELIAAKNNERVDFKIEGINIDDSINFKVVSYDKIEIDYLVSDKIYVDNNFYLNILIPNYLNENKVKIELPNNINLVEKNGFNLVLVGSSAKKESILIKYENKIIAAIDLEIYINEKIKIENKKYFENGDKIIIEGEIYVTGEYLYRFISVETNDGYEVIDINKDDIELLSKQKTKIQVRIELKKHTSETLSLMLKYREVETIEEIIVKVF